VLDAQTAMLRSSLGLVDVLAERRTIETAVGDELLTELQAWRKLFAPQPDKKKGPAPKDEPS
jgi:hypothetical protein